MDGRKVLSGCLKLRIDTQRCLVVADRSVEIAPAAEGRATIVVCVGEGWVKLDRAVVVGDSAAQITLGLVRVAAIGEKIRARRNSNRLVIDPKLSLAFRDRGAAYYFNKDYERAIKDYDEAIKLDLRSDRAYSNRSAAYKKLGRNEQAITDESEAIKLEPSEPAYFDNRGLSYAAEGDYDRRHHRLTQLSPTPTTLAARRSAARAISTERSPTTRQRCVSIRGMRQPLRTLRPSKLCASGQ